MTVHLCQNKSQLDKLTSNDLFLATINENILYGDGLRPDYIYGAKSYNNVDNKYAFRSHIDAALNAKIERTDAFKNTTRIVKSWARTLTENSQWHLKINEHLGDGVYLN